MKISKRAVQQACQREHDAILRCCVEWVSVHRQSRLTWRIIRWYCMSYAIT